MPTLLPGDGGAIGPDATSVAPGDAASVPDAATEGGLPSTQGWSPILNTPSVPVAVSSVAVSPDPSVAIAVGNSVFRTTDGGHSWQHLNAASTLSGFVFDPTDATVVYALGKTPGAIATDASSLFRSTDTGLTWQAVSSVTDTWDEWPGAVLAIVPKQPATMYLASSVLARSTDGGSTWTDLALSMDDAGASLYLHGVVVDPSVANRLYVYVTLTASMTDALMVSDDGGGTWTTLYTGTYINCPPIVAPDDSEVLYLDVDDSVCRSADAGQTWSCHPHPTVTPPPGGPITDSMYLVASDPSVLYLAQRNGAGDYKRAFRSTDGGATWLADTTSADWQAVTTGHLYANVNGALSVSPGWGSPWTPSVGLDIRYSNWVGYAPSGEGVVYAMTSTFFASDGTIREPALWRSTDRGQTWSATSDLPGGVVLNPSDNRSVWGTDIDVTFGPTVVQATHANAGGPSCYGKSDGPQAPCPFLGMSVDPGDPTSRYACSNASLYATHDGATGWSPVSAPTDCVLTAINPASPASLYVAGSAGLAISPDRGTTWSTAAGLPAGSTAEWFVFDPLVTATVYASVSTTIGSRFYASHDGGASWVPTGWPVDGSATLAIDPHSSRVMYAGGAGGVMKTVDGGASWFPINHGLQGESVCSLSVSPDDGALLYLAACVGGFYYSTTGGE